jgi:hypothetical protein
MLFNPLINLISIISDEVTHFMERKKRNIITKKMDEKWMKNG